MTTLYARRITLRNCGRFSVIQSDFGADYRTHTHVTGEALYASLTRGATWQPRRIVVGEDTYEFTRDYRVDEMPLWFTPGVFHHEEYGPYLPPETVDTSFFNAVSEVYPVTSRAYAFDRKTRNLRLGNRPGHVPTYGTWQTILPNQRMVTYAFSARRELLESFAVTQTFMLGKKRTMFQIMGLSVVVDGQMEQGRCTTEWLELPPTHGGLFSQFEMLAGTVRYIILQGTTREEVSYFEFSFPDRQLCLPHFYLEQVPI